MNPQLVVSASNLRIPFLGFPEKNNAPKNRRLFYSDILPSENNESLISPSILQSYSLVKPERLHWLYHQLLMMHFEKPIIHHVLRSHAGMLDYNYTREELLNRAIDYCLSQNDHPLVLDDQGAPPLFIQIEQEEEKDGPNILSSNYSLLSSDTIFRSIRRCANPNQEGEAIDPKFCRICYNEPETLHTIEICRHKFCFDCIYGYLKSKIEHYDPKSIECPSDGCGEPLDEVFIEEMLKNDQILLEKYKKFKGQLEILDHPERKWCIRPDCPHYVEIDVEQKTNKVVCKCGQNMCFACANAWHEGMTCLEAADKEYRKYEEKVVVKQCPKCLAKIEKNEGCNHMTCSRCKYEFCWVCKAECINGYCVKNCPKFPENNARNRRLNANFFCRITNSNSFFGAIANFFRFWVNFMFFLILSNILILFTFLVAIGKWFVFVFTGHNSLMFSIFREREGIENAFEKICKVLTLPFKFLMLLVAALLVLVIQMLKIPFLVFFNICKYIYFFQTDRTALSILIYERFIEFGEENISVLPRVGCTRVMILLMSIFYVEALIWGYYEIIQRGIGA